MQSINPTEDPRMSIQSLKQLLAAASAALACLASSSSQAAPVSYSFAWTGDAGHAVRGQFSFDAGTAPAIISESGAGPTNHLQSLSVSFFDPTNVLLQSFGTVVNGVSSSSFFAFNFDTATEQLFGSFNVGGGALAAGVQFFNGTVGGLLRLRENIDDQGSSVLLDSSNPGRIMVTNTAQVPEPGTLVLCLGALLALGATPRRWRGSAA
jgi:hypothetical protein